MSESTHATLRASVESLTSMITQSALDGETEHADIYLNVLEDRVQVLQSTPGETVLTYCTFGEDYFDDLSLDREIREFTGNREGNEYDYEVGAEAILDVEQTLTYLDMASGGGTVEIEFTGSDDRRLSTYMRAQGALEAWVKLPGSQDVLDDVPHWLPNRFDNENNYCNTAGDAAPTTIETKTQKLETIVQAVDNDRDAEFYPVTVEDGSFTINVGDESRSGVRGQLGGQSVEGPDVENYYFDGFEEILNVISGHIELQTVPGNGPLYFQQDDGQGKIIRHVNGSVNN